MLTFTRKENVEVRCERKVRRVHQKHLTLKEQNKQQGKNNDLENSEEKIMTKLCPRGKAAAKRKFAVYPSAYANAYASKICAGKIKDPSGVKRKDFKGRKKAAGGGLMEATQRLRRQGLKKGSVARGCGAIMPDRTKETKMYT
jgi:hypothetical protein